MSFVRSPEFAVRSHYFTSTAFQAIVNSRLFAGQVDTATASST